LTEESVSDWESSDASYAGSDGAHRKKMKRNAMLKKENANKENGKFFSLECVVCFFKLFTHLMIPNAEHIFRPPNGYHDRNNGWDDMMDMEKQVDYGQHIGKIVTVEKPPFKSPNLLDTDDKDEEIATTGLTQQLFSSTQKDTRKDGLDSISIKSPNLLATDDEEEDIATVIDKENKTVGTITQELEEQENQVSPGGTRKRAWWEACTTCEEFPCIWAQYGKSAKDNDAILNLMIGSQYQPPSIVRRKRAFVHVATLLFGKLGLGHLKDLPACVVSGVRENWPAPNGVYTTDGAE
jgi:hypothetical protein